MMREKFLVELPRELEKGQRFPWCVLRRVSVRVHTRLTILCMFDQIRRDHVMNDTPEEWNELREKFRQKEAEIFEMFPCSKEREPSRFKRRANKDYLDVLIPLLRYYSE